MLLFSEIVMAPGSLSLPFVQTKKSMSGYIGLMELLCAVIRFGYPGFCIRQRGLKMTILSRNM
jgi:hypothetical protein